MSVPKTKAKVTKEMTDSLPIIGTSMPTLLQVIEKENMDPNVEFCAIQMVIVSKFLFEVGIENIVDATIGDFLQRTYENKAYANHITGVKI